MNVTSIFFQRTSSVINKLYGMEKYPNITYDFLFIGLGASNSLILLSLIEKKQLKNKRVAIFETESKVINDKTFCFWAAPDDSIVTNLAPIISHCFTTIQVNQSPVQRIDQQPYHYIRSIDLYNHTREILTTEQIDMYQKGVNGITYEDDFYWIHTDSDNYKAHYIFDSRPPILDQSDKKQVYLHQSFYGLHIKCNQDVFVKNTFEMMNFDVDQHEYTQFMYVIPFSTNEALIELTRFGANKIEQTYALEVLDKFITRNFGKYELLADESGCIPMTTYITPPNQFEGVLHTGASANLIKPSTGYGFKNMHAFAQRVTKCVESNTLKNFNTIGLDAKKRFKFYDKLLLLILLHWPAKGKLIFTRLFEKQTVLTIFSFLDEKSSLYQEVKIFASLPILSFLKALLLYLKIEKWTRYVYAFVIVITYLILSSWNNQIASYFGYILLVVGLLLIGIPHGALDHILSKNKETHLVNFIAKYVFIILLYFIIWQQYPVIALSIFILYSSFHFGESELIDTNKQIDTFNNYLHAFLLGLSILLFIIFSHLNESLSIISGLVSVAKLDSLNVTFITPTAIILSISYLLIQSVLSKKGSYIGLIFLLLLGVKIPLMLAFGLYFIFQHSFNAWQHLKSGLQMSSLQLLKKSSLYTIAALLMLLFIIIFDYKKIININSLWINFFIFIACISFPHFVLMHIFYKKNL